MSSPEGTTPFDVSELQKCALCGDGMAHGMDMIMATLGADPDRCKDN